MQWLTPVRSLKRFKHGLYSIILHTILRDCQTIMFFTQWQKIQRKFFGYCRNTKSAICCTAGNHRGNRHMGEFLLYIAMNMGRIDLLCLQQLVQQQPGA